MKMKAFFGLCLIVAVVSVGEARKTYRASAACEPGHCLVKDGKMCRCDEDGILENAKCIDKIPPFSVRNILAEYTDVSCKCTPGEEFRPDGYVCTCPESGELKPENCVPNPKRSTVRRRNNHVRSKTYRSIVTDECVPETCVFYEGKICACGGEGQVDTTACFPSGYGYGIYPSRRRVYGDEPLCLCEPDTIFELETHTCVCPEDGALDPKEDCTAKRTRFGL